MGPRALILLAWLLAAAACSAPRPVERSPVPRLARPAVPGKIPSSEASSGRDLFLEEEAAPGLSGSSRERLIGDWPPRATATRVRLSGLREPIREVLGRLAAVSRLNFVLADEVRGEITTSLEEVTWTEALRAILAAKDLVAVREGNVVRVLRREDLAREAGLSP